MIEVVAGYGTREMRMYGRYERVGDVYRLRAWRISFVVRDNPNEVYQGDWNKVHGNQRRDIGAARLVATQEWIDSRELVTS